jgi:hypothetical protein
MNNRMQDISLKRNVFKCMYMTKKKKTWNCILNSKGIESFRMLMLSPSAIGVTRRKTCIFYWTLELKFSCKQHLRLKSH